MIPLPSPLMMLAVVIALGSSYMAGRHDGSRLAAAKQAQATMEAARQDIRTAEKLQQKFTAEEEKLRENIRDLDRRLGATVAELRRTRTTRAAVATAATVVERKCEGASGAELSSEDAEFLAREAARADRVVELLGMCQREYEALRLTCR